MCGKMKLKIKAFVGESEQKCLALYTELGHLLGVIDANHPTPLNSGIILSNLWRYLLCMCPDVNKPGHSIKIRYDISEDTLKLLTDYEIKA